MFARHLRGLTALLVLLPLVGTGCAATMGASSGLQRDVDDLRVAVDRLRQEQTETQRRVDDVQAPPARHDVEAQVLLLRDRVEALEAQIRALARSIEGNDEVVGSLSYDLERLRRGQESLSRDLAALAAGGSVAGGEPGSPSGDLPLADGPDVGPTVVTAPSPETTQRVRPEDDPAGVFQKAYADYTRGDYELATLGFTSVIEYRPDGALADDASYYLGEIASAQGQTEEALRWYTRVTDDHPDGDKIQAATLKKGLLLIDANRIGEGVLQLDHLARTWPESDEARLARNKLRALGVGP